MSIYNSNKAEMPPAALSMMSREVKRRFKQEKVVVCLSQRLMVLAVSFLSATVFFAALGPAAGDLRKVDNISLEYLTEAANAAVAILEKVGEPVSENDRIHLSAALKKPGIESIGTIQDILDRYCLLGIRINEEGWLSTTLASNELADRRLVKGRWKYFLIKISNESAVKAPILVRSPQELLSDELKDAETLPTKSSTRPDSWYRWIGLQTFDPQLTSESPGLTLRYLVLGIFSRDQGMRAADLEFYFSGGAVSQGHYTSQRLLFDVAPAGVNGK
jgi:hypothetical protein